MAELSPFQGPVPWLSCTGCCLGWSQQLLLKRLSHTQGLGSALGNWTGLCHVPCSCLLFSSLRNFLYSRICCNMPGELTRGSVSVK